MKKKEYKNKSKVGIEWKWTGLMNELERLRNERNKGLR